MKRTTHWLLYVFFLTMIITLFFPQIASATGWVNEKVGDSTTGFNFTQFPLENYALDFYVDTAWKWLPWKWGEGIGDAVIYGLYAITNVFWLLHVYVSYFIGYIVQEAFNLDFITNLLSGIAKNMQQIAGLDGNGLRSTGLFPRFMPLFIAIFGAYIAYLGGVKRQTTKAIQQTVVFLLTFIMSGVFLMHANSYLSSVNNAQKDINNEMLTIAESILPNSKNTSSTQSGKSATNAIRENLFELQVYTPYLLLQYGESDAKELGEKRIDSILSHPQLAENNLRENAVEKEVKEKKNQQMSVNGAFLRFGMTLLLIITNGVISYSVAVLTITMITSQILFLLFCAFLPVAMIFSLFPASNRLLFQALQKVAQALFTKMGITLILAVVFSLSHSFFGLAKAQGYIWVLFLQVATWLTAVNRTQELLGFMHIGGADTRSGSRLGRLAKNMVMAGTVRSLLKRTPSTPSLKNKTASPTPSSPRFKQPLAKQVGEKISAIQDMPNRLSERKNNWKESVKQAPTTAKYKAMEMRNQYDEGRIGQEIKNSSDRNQRINQRQLTHQQRLEALKQQENRKKEAVRNELAHKTPKTFDQTKLPKEKTAIQPIRQLSTGKRIGHVPSSTIKFQEEQPQKQASFARQASYPKNGRAQDVKQKDPLSPSSSKQVRKKQITKDLVPTIGKDYHSKAEQPTSHKLKSRTTKR